MALRDYIKHHHKKMYKTDMPDHIADSHIERVINGYAGKRKPEEAFSEAFKDANS